MGVPFDLFISDFLSKITERDLLMLEEDVREETVLGFMKRAVNGFKYVCKYDLAGSCDNENKCFDVDIPAEELDEIVDIISEGMIIQWLKPYVYRQELLENAINTRDFSVYSPGELLMRVGNAYKEAKSNFTQMVREYSYNTGDLTELHL